MNLDILYAYLIRIWIPHFQGVPVENHLNKSVQNFSSQISKILFRSKIFLDLDTIVFLFW